MEGAYFNLEKISSILKTYGIEELKKKFLLLGLVQNKKTVDEFVSGFKKYDTEDDWTYGFTVYDTSTEREQILNQIIKDIKSKLL